VASRQEAVKELRPSVNLREDLALMGDEVRAALDDRRLGVWGTEPAVTFFPGAGWIALILAIAAVTTAVTTLLELTTLRPFLFVVLGELAFGMATRVATRRVVHDVENPRTVRLITASGARVRWAVFVANVEGFPERLADGWNAIC
jgi:hypothetical protein